MALVVKSLPANAGNIRDSGSMPGSRRSLGGGHGNPLQYSCLGPMDRGPMAGYSPQSCKELDMTEVTKHACKLTGNILTRLPRNESRKEEINTSPLEYVRTRKYLHQLTVFFFYFTSSPSPLCSVKETTIQIWARCFFGALVHRLICLLAFQMKLLLLAAVTRLSIQWSVVWLAVQAWAR